MTEIGAWVGIGFLSASSVVGWTITYFRNSKSQATMFGSLEKKVNQLGVSLQSQETSISKLTSRIDGLVRVLGVCDV